MATDIIDRLTHPGALSILVQAQTKNRHQKYGCNLRHTGCGGRVHIVVPKSHFDKLAKDGNSIC